MGARFCTQDSENGLLLNVNDSSGLVFAQGDQTAVGQ
jgi:hypothetical protein